MMRLALLKLEEESQFGPISAISLHRLILCTCAQWTESPSQTQLPFLGVYDYAAVIRVARMINGNTSICTLFSTIFFHFFLSSSEWVGNRHMENTHIRFTSLRNRRRLTLLLTTLQMRLRPDDPGAVWSPLQGTIVTRAWVYRSRKRPTIHVRFPGTISTVSSNLLIHSDLQFT